MLPSPTHTDPPPVLRIKAFQRPGHLHAFSTRRGGIPQDGSLEAVWPGFIAAAGFSPSATAVPLHQVHGHAVHVVRRTGATGAGATADAAVTDRPGAVLMVRTADCVPILLAGAGSGVVGVAHAGWRGALAGVVHETVEAMVDMGAHRASIHAAVGPAIGPCCFQVGPDVARRFARLRPDLVEERPAGPQVDLPGAVAFLLERAGVAPAAIHRLAACTSCRVDLFFSHRREEGHTGRLVAAIGVT